MDLKRGEASHKSKLTAEQVIEIRSGPTKGMSGKLAKKYGITRQAMLDVIHGKSWKHI
jgi:hypothetical protein